jgi:glycosyltransferase involved in cell wall biosynthesis
MHTGLGQYAWHLLKALLSLYASDKSLRFVALLPDSGLEAEQQVWLKQQKQLDLFILTSRHRAKVPRILRASFPRVDLWVCLSQDSAYWCSDFQVPIVLVVHDLNFLYREKISFLKSKIKLNALQKRVNRSTQVVAISHYVQQDIEKNLSIPDNKITMIYCGLNDKAIFNEKPSLVIWQDLLKAWNLPLNKRTLLSVGEAVAKKNLKILILMMQYLPSFQLVLAGRQHSDYAEELKQMIKQYQLENRVVMIGGLSEPQKQAAFAHSAAFVFPSLSEGFGLPVLEAFREGCPVFMFAKTSLPEVGGNWGYYWMSDKPESMANFISETFDNMQNDIQWSQLQKEGRKNQASQFSWEAAAKAYQSIFESILSHK